MKQIILNISDENVQTVMSILNNLKDGLIDSIEGAELKGVHKTAYTPKQGTIVSEEEKPVGKYASAATYKSRLKKR